MHFFEWDLFSPILFVLFKNLYYTPNCKQVEEDYT
nr:MAG TPA: hypothetical protein [Bacteriophage sp.]